VSWGEAKVQINFYRRNRVYLMDQFKNQTKFQSSCIITEKDYLFFLNKLTEITESIKEESITGKNISDYRSYVEIVFSENGIAKNKEQFYLQSGSKTTSLIFNVLEICSCN
jgi:hypothetical protein